MKNLQSITEKLFSQDLLKNKRANKIELTYYSFLTQKYQTLSVCRKTINALKSAVEYLNANPKIDEISIQGWLIQNTLCGSKTEHHEFSTTITQSELKSVI